MSKGKKKPVEWKDTKFPFSVDYNYSLFVKNRCVFFYSLAKNIKKNINYAANFTMQNNICVIYVYGNVNREKIYPLIAQYQGHILILVMPSVTADDFKPITEYNDWIKKLKSRGLADNNNKPNEAWRKYGNPDETFIINNYNTVLSNIKMAALSQYEIIANFQTLTSISGAEDKHNGELLEIIRGLFPYGVESDTNDDYAVKMLKIKRLVKAAINGEKTKDSDLLNITFVNSDQICLWDNSTVGASECLHMLKSYCKKCILEKGCIWLPELWYQFSKAPYGAYECNWYEYLFALAIQDFYTKNYFWGGCYHSERIVSDNFDSKYKTGFIFTQNDKQNEFRKLFAKLFDIKKPAETTQNMISQVRTWVTNNIKHTPLDWVDGKLREILAGKDDDDVNVRAWEKKQQYWYEFGYENEYLDWLNDNFDSLYRRIRTADKDFNTELAKKYGQWKADMFCKLYTVKGGAVGWLHSKEMIYERVEDYMKSNICLECGHQIGVIGHVDFGYEYSEMNEETKKFENFRFTEKQIIGLNKKLLGRAREEFFCIPCLSEYTESSIPELWHMMNDFIEQGCELF